ncbi:hypothetical protein Gotri_025062, partial [Gossypium trilobum]|nr:hypothetical protein [Gossypium trilobum]
MKVDDMIISELNKVKDLEEEAKDKCFIGLCPNVKAFYQLSKKAEEDAGAVVELLQQGGFDRISYLDVPPPIVVVPPKDFEDFDSRKLVFNKIMEAVKDPNLNIIGVYGMPGVGKTTLVKEVIRQVKEDKLFDSVSMAVVTHTPDVQKIQDQIADMLGMKFEEKSITGRASRLCQRLKKEKKILVVLDDIWTGLDLMEVGIPLGDKDQVCTILLTSRSSNVLKKDMDAKKSFPIGVLEDKEAWDFFKKIAGDGVESHDLHPIATQDVLNDWPDDETMKECDKISLLFPSINKLPDQLKCPILTFFLVVSSNDPLMKIPANLLKEMKNLKVLILGGMNLPSLPSSISLLVNLRTLSLDHCALGDIALIEELKNLEILNFSGSDIEMLPKEIGQLTKLKWLDLTDCSKLKRIPPGVFCKLSRLEELYIDNSFDEWGAEGQSSLQGNSSIAELKALSCLTSLHIHIPNAKIIPNDFSFVKLRRYIIFIGEASHWDWKWDRKAENLYIDEVKGVELLLHEAEVGDYFQQLKNLHIQNGAMVQYIFKDIDDVHKIEFLQLESLSLKGLPNLISFCSTNKGSTSISPQEIGLFKQKVFTFLIQCKHFISA